MVYFTFYFFVEIQILFVLTVPTVSYCKIMLYNIIKMNKRFMCALQRNNCQGTIF